MKLIVILIFAFCGKMVRSFDLEDYAANYTRIPIWPIAPLPWGCRGIREKVILETELIGCQSRKCGYYGKTDEWLYYFQGTNKCCNVDGTVADGCSNNHIEGCQYLKYYTCIENQDQTPCTNGYYQLEHVGCGRIWDYPRCPIVVDVKDHTQAKAMLADSNDNYFYSRSKRFDLTPVEIYGDTKIGSASSVCTRIINDLPETFTYKRVVKSGNCCFKFDNCDVKVNHPCCARYKEQTVQVTITMNKKEKCTNTSPCLASATLPPFTLGTLPPYWKSLYE